MSVWFDNVWAQWYYESPQTILDNNDQGNTSTYTQTDYLDRPAGNWGPSFQSNQIQGPSYGNIDGNNYGSDYFMDAFGYQVGYAPTTAPTEPTTYGAGLWVTNSQGIPTYVAQPLPSTADDPTRVPV